MAPAARALRCFLHVPTGFVPTQRAANLSAWLDDIYSLAISDPGGDSCSWQKIILKLTRT